MNSEREGRYLCSEELALLWLFFLLLLCPTSSRDTYYSLLLAIQYKIKKI